MQLMAAAAAGGLLRTAPGGGPSPPRPNPRQQRDRSPGERWGRVRGIRRRGWREFRNPEVAGALRVPVLPAWLA